MRSSERNELLVIASDNLKLKPKTHRNEFTSRLKSHEAITTRVVTGPTTISCTSGERGVIATQTTFLLTAPLFFTFLT